MTRWESYCERQRRAWGDKFKAPTEQRWIDLYNSQQRVRVDDCGRIVTGTVSASSGWAPCFLLMRSSRSLGSSVVLSESTKLLAVKPCGKYVARSA